jgi:plastocyanin
MRRTLMLLLLAAVACGGSYESGTTGGGGNQVGLDTGQGVAIQWTLAAQNAPVTTTVAAGTAVRWHNGDGTTHTVEPDSSPPPSRIASIGGGATSATQTIMTPGTYHYHCAIHPAMHGTLIVQ